jgi:SAM-dependent methyltransferase
MTNGRTTLACPLCESHRPDDYKFVGYGSQADGVREFQVLRCRVHGVEFADALPKPCVDSKQKAGLDYCYGDPNEPNLRYMDFMDRLEAVTGPAGERLLHDVGCGNGQLMFEARRRGWRVQGNDIVSGVKGDLEKNGITCFIGSLSELPLESGTCDVLTSFCVLPHHLPDPRADMHMCHRVLKPGGWLVLQIPDNGLFRRTGKLLYHALLPGRPLQFSKFVLANLYGPGGHQFAYKRKNLAQYVRRQCQMHGRIAKNSRRERYRIT